MTAGTVAPYRSGQAPKRGGFTQLLWAEWIKFRTVRGWVTGMVAALLVTVLVGLVGAVGNSCSFTAPGGAPAACALPTGPGGEPVTDSFYFVHQLLTGNGSMTVEVTALTGLVPSTSAGGPDAAGPGSTANMHSGLEPWAKAGVIIKENTRQGSAYAAVMVTGRHGVRMQYNFTHDVAGPSSGVSATSPRWLRLTRSGDTLTGYQSGNGVHWTKIGTATLTSVTSTVQAGLFVSSPPYTQSNAQSLGGSGGSGGPTLATAVFDHVSLQGGFPGGTWNGENVGASSATLGGSLRQAGGSLTVSGSGDIAPAVPGGPNLGTTIAQTLLGAFVGLIVMIVVGTLFITAEYRRGLIRVTFAASPRRGCVLAAKAVVIGAVTFVVGLAAVAVAVPLGRAILRHHNYVFPVGTLTAVRVVVGTAALLAVAVILALAVGALLRRSAAAVTIVISAIVLPYLLAVSSALPVGASDWLLRVTPAAAFAIQQTTPQYSQVSTAYTPANGYFPLAPWVGFAVLCGYALAALALAVVTLRRRDA